MPTHRIDDLTRIQVLTLVSSGHTPSSISAQFGVARRTIAGWRKNAMDRGWGGGPMDMLKQEHLWAVGSPEKKASGAKEAISSSGLEDTAATGEGDDELSEATPKKQLAQAQKKRSKTDADGNHVENGHVEKKIKNEGDKNGKKEGEKNGDNKIKKEEDTKIKEEEDTEGEPDMVGAEHICFDDIDWEA